MSAAPEISQVELQKLLKILGMLGSAHDGERAAAALKAHQWVVAAETSWAALLTPPPEANPVVSVGVKEGRGKTAGPGPQTASQANWQSWAQQAAAMNAQAYGGGLGAQNAYGAGINAAGPGAPIGKQASWQAAATAMLQHYPNSLRGAKEEDFVAGLLKKGWPKLTDKQADWLRDICGRAGVTW